MILLRISRIALTAVLMAALGIGSALADNPHFVNANASISDPGGNLTVTFKEAGLGNGETVTVELDGNASAVWGCINGGGNHPQASNKETRSSSIISSGQFTADRHGNINGFLPTAGNTIDPPGPGSLTCPGTQTLGLISISYTGLVLRDLTTGATIQLSDVTRVLINVR